MSARRSSLPLSFGVGLIAVLAFSLAAFYIAMHPPAGDLRLMALFLGATTALSGLAGYAAYRQEWLLRITSLRLALLGGYALASLLTFINVWVTARLMFANQHDLQLATVLLVFATGIAMLLGYFLTRALTGRIEALKSAAGRLAERDLEARAAVEGRDEIAALAVSFNEMAGRLQAADQKQRELEQLRRDLVAWASHDLQTPLTAIRVRIEALADGMVDDPATIQRYLRTTQRQVEDLSRLIDDLFQIAQLDAGGLVIQPAASSLYDLISDALESFASLAAEKGVTLRAEVAPEVDPVVLDAPRIGRVLSNLIANALRHTPAGGSVSVAARREGGHIRIDVADNGDGISSTDLPHIFDRFYRGEKSRNRDLGGTGLGLAIAKGIIEAHNGEIWVESRPGEGATFSISLKD